MRVSLQPVFILVKNNDPNGNQSGVYLLLSENTENAMLLRLDAVSHSYLIKDPMKLEALKALNGKFFKTNNVEGIKIFDGGNALKEELYALHCAPSYQDSLEVFKPFLNFTEVSVLTKNETIVAPNMCKFFSGVTFVDQQKMQRHLKKGQWLKREAPALIAFGNEVSEVGDVLKKEGRKYHSGSKFFLTKLISGIRTLRRFMWAAAEAQVAMVRISLFSALQSRSDLSQEQKERVLEAMVAIYAHDLNGGLKYVAHLQDEEFKTPKRNFSLKNIAKEYFMPMLAVDRQYKRITEKLKANRLAHELVVFENVSSKKRRGQPDTKTSKRAEALEQQLNEIADLSKKKD